MEDLELPLQLVSNIEIRGNITAAVAIVRSRPHGNQVWVFEPVLEAIHHELMSTGDKFKSIDVAEFASYTGTE